jgi:CheY-like chemotaxis protein
MIKVKILIVDDEEDFCMVMRNYFIKKGYEVLLAFNLFSGLQLLKEKEPDVLFLDNNLPDGDGWSHTESILERNPSLQINLISAYKEKDFRLDSFPNVNIWEKPISIRRLEEVFSMSTD